ncbi:glycosyltransferase [Mycolicibacterium vaccae]|uniref:Glycosyl transferase family protein n=1 Tax=Mycolicibacterium vaccae ATCC 25954 TaxID=1194972 RepID=K0V143_MYCVA|nr:glycosyltransferase [Mycolicibacterium vaccae]ANI37922.1 glycosyl transferase family 2 [Mycolicibacterium vaccae 95051]EJZ08608.1 glycosyl transferase family protein [Mycolicibacterium vaccae ATCC 25954]
MTITIASTSPSRSPRDRKSRPAVSICIPAYQAQRHLSATLDSALAQDSDDFEVVVVDNNSSDGTGRLLDGLADPRVRVLRNDVTVPMIDNFNLAIRRSRGRYVKLVCADDILAPDCVRVQAAALDAMPEVTLVSARTDFIDDNGAMMRPDRGLPGIAGRQPADHVVRRIVRSGTNPIGPPVAAMFRRADFDRCGGFRHVSSFLSELDLWVRLLSRGEFYGVPRTLAAFRIASGSTTALTSARSQLGQILGFSGMLAADPAWNVTAGDRIYGRVRSCDMQIRRTGLYALSTIRSRRSAHDH